MNPPLWGLTKNKRAQGIENVANSAKQRVGFIPLAPVLP